MSVIMIAKDCRLFQSSGLSQTRKKKYQIFSCSQECSFLPQLFTYWSPINQLVKVFIEGEECMTPHLWHGVSFHKMLVTKPTWSIKPFNNPQGDTMTHSLLTGHTLYSLCSVALWISARLLLVTNHAFAMTDAPNPFSPLSSWNHSCVVP